MEQNAYYGINVEYVNPAYFAPQKYGPQWSKKTNGNPVTVTALTSIKGDPVEFYKTNYSRLISNFLIGDLEKAIVQIDQPKK